MSRNAEVDLNSEGLESDIPEYVPYLRPPRQNEFELLDLL